MKKMIRVIALLLALMLVLQCAAFAAEPETEPILSDIVLAEAPAEEPGDPVPPAVEIVTNFTDGQVFSSVRQTLTVSATADGAPVDPAEIKVMLNGEAVALSGGGYSLKLKAGNNAVEITARGTVKALNLRFEIAIPSGWAKKALTFCVEQGILNGDQNGDLAPTNSATRAQLAAMMVRLFGAQLEADISGYQDVSATAWYYAELSRAVAMGIFEGSGGKLTPNNKITREQAFAVLSRAFGVAAETTDSLDEFSDRGKVSQWALYNVAGMLEAGYVHGNTNGTLNPKGNITRQELAQVLYNALDCITTDPDALTGKRNLYTGPIEGLAGKTIDGDLILSCSCGETVTLDGFTVTGRLVLQLAGAKNVTLGKVCDTVSVCCPIELTLSAPVKKLICMRDGAVIRGDAETLVSLADASFFGNYDKAYFQSGNPTVAAVSKIGRMEVSRPVAGSTVTVHGEVSELHARADRLTLTGSGHVGTLYAYRSGLNNKLNTDQYVDHVDAGLGGVKIESVSSPKVYYDDLTVTVTGKVTGVNSEQVYGVPGGVRTCTVTYSYNGTVVKTDENFKLTEGAELSCTFECKLEYRVEAAQRVAVTISYGNETLSDNLSFIGTGRWSDYTLAKEVRTIRVQGSMYYTTTIYAYSNLTSPVATLAAGTEVFYMNYGDVALVETRSGIRGYCDDDLVRVSWQNYHSDEVSYTDGVKEAFVNQLHDYSSPSKYLIWCNLYTTTVNIFEGSKGNWKLIKSCECTIGAPNTPTRPGVYHIYSHAYYWSFDVGSTLDVDRCYYASLFDGGIAFHTRLYYTGTDEMVNPTLGGELSHGCVRCPDDIAKFIYNQCPTGTTVVVY